MNIAESKKSNAHKIVEIIDYLPNSVVIKSIIRKACGNIRVMAFDSGEEITERVLPYDTFAQILHGKAEIIIDGISHIVKSGQGIIIPAHLKNIIKANERFKMMQTIIKSPHPRKKLILKCLFLFI